MRWIWVILCASGCGVFPCPGAESASTNQSRFRSDLNLVLVPATVWDQSDHLVTGLKQSDFRLFDGKNEQRIVSVTLEDTPVSVGIVFDSSGSMKRAQRFAVDALREFLSSSNPHNEYCAIQVRDRPEFLLDFTTDADLVLNRLAAAPPIGATALIDSVYLAASHMRNATYRRRMLLVITDGEDNNSRYNLKELKRMLEETDVRVYTVGVGVRSPLFFETGLSAVQTLSIMAEATGGRYLEASSPGDLPDAIQKIDIRYEYVLGFVPPAGSTDGRFHRLEVKVVAPGKLRAFHRQGYYAPLATAAESKPDRRRAYRENTLLRPEPAGDAEPRH